MLMLPTVAVTKTHSALSLPMALLTLTTLLCLPSQSLAVEYEIRFDATWSAATHPTAYPSSAHFSPLIGTTHDDQVTFWELGGIATPGIEQMAETGGTSNLEAEIALAGDDAGNLIFRTGPNSPGVVSTIFDIASSHSLVTLVTMVAPSPDWFVGVDRLDLYEGGSWAPELVVDLYAYDAGTDSGVDFDSGNADITPHIPIELLGAPLSGTPALGTFTFTLIGGLPPGDGNYDGKVDGLDYVIWATAFGDDPAADPPGSPANGDFDDNGVVNGLDYVVWATNFGVGTATAVPEPMSLSLAALAGAAVVLLRRRVL